MYDMWSLGCVLFIMVTGKMPFNDKNASQLLKQQMSRSLNYPFGCLASSHCKQLIRELLNPKPDQRPDTDKVLTSKWLAKPAVGRTSVSGLSGAARRQHVLLNQ